MISAEYLTHQPRPFLQTAECLFNTKNFNWLSKVILRSSFQVQLKDYRAFHLFGKGDILVLAGTSTAGKSSIISSLKQIKDRLVHGLDTQSYEMAFAYLKTDHHEDYAFLNSVLMPKKHEMHLMHAILWSIYVFKPDVSEENQARAKEKGNYLNPLVQKAIRGIPLRRETLMLDRVLTFSINGYNSILDVIEIDSIFQHLINRRYHAPLRMALVYCPFRLLTERIVERTEKLLKAGSSIN